MSGSELLTADELAGRLHLRPSTIKRWARAGRIPSVRPSPKVLRFDPAAVVEAIKTGRNPEGVPHAG